MHIPRPHDLVESKDTNTMSHFEKNDREPLSRREAAEKEPSSKHHGTLEHGPEVVEDWHAWLHVLAGFVTYVNVS